MMRRPMRRRGVGLLGATVIAGGAYAAGSSRQKSAYQEQSQDQRINELEAQQAMASAPPPPVAAAAPPARDSSQDRIAQLKQLADLKAQGILTDAEFEREKARILG